MTRLTHIIVFLLFATNIFSQGNLVNDGWIKADLSVDQKSKEKLRQNSLAGSEDNVKGNVWLDSAEGWLKLCYSIHIGAKKASTVTYQESIPIYDQGFVLWELGALHRLEGPGYFFEFKIFSISESQVQGKNTNVSLYYRWVVKDRWIALEEESMQK